MTNGAWLLLLSLAVALIIDVPVAFALLFAAISYLLIFDSAPMMVAAQQYVAGMQSFTLLAIPLFVFAAELMNRVGLTERIINLCRVLVGKKTGGLAIVAIMACTLFGALSGSGVADVIAIGSILLPAMKQANYDPKFSSALVGTSSSIGTVIPPSIVMIVYGTASNTSIGKLFMGGIIPGLMLMGALMLVAWYCARKNGWAGGKQYNRQEKFQAWKAALPALVVPVLIIGGIRGGIFTPTEAAVSAICYSLILGFGIYRQLSLKSLWEALQSTAEISATILLLIAAAGLYAWCLNYEQVPQAIASWVTSFANSKWLVLFMMMALILLMGTFIESIAIIIIVTPIILPLMAQYHIDPVYFGVLLTVNLAIGANTPPLGIDLMAACKLGGISIIDTIKPLSLMLLAMIIVLILLTVFPQLILWLPNFGA